MTRALLVVLMLSGTALPVAAQSRFTDIMWKTSMVTAMAAHGGDGGVTVDCIARGLCKEINPILMHLSKQPGPFLAAKMGGAALSIWATSRAPKPVGIVINFAVTVLMTSVAYHNSRVTAHP